MGVIRNTGRRYHRLVSSFLQQLSAGTGLLEILSDKLVHAEDETEDLEEQILLSGHLPRHLNFTGIRRDEKRGDVLRLERLEEGQVQTTRSFGTDSVITIEPEPAFLFPAQAYEAPTPASGPAYVRCIAGSRPSHGDH